MNKIFSAIFLSIFSSSAHARGSGIDLGHLFLYGGAFFIFLIFLRSTFTVPAKIINFVNGYELSDGHGLKVWMAMIWTAAIPIGVAALIAPAEKLNNDSAILLFGGTIFFWFLFLNIFFRSQRD
jgi:hypothetical protein